MKITVDLEMEEVIKYQKYLAESLFSAYNNDLYNNSIKYFYGLNQQFLTSIFGGKINNDTK